MSELEQKRLRDKIMKGLKLSFERLVHEKKQKNEDLIFSRNGKIIKIKAKDIKIKKNADR